MLNALANANFDTATFVPCTLSATFLLIITTVHHAQFFKFIFMFILSTNIVLYRYKVSLSMTMEPKKGPLRLANDSVLFFLLY